jgi:hypothetical protein
MTEGLGWAHAKRRRALIAALVPGTPCPLCGHPLMKDPAYGWLARLQLDHETPRAMGGIDGPVRLTHAWCNMSAGGRLGTRIRWGSRQKAAERPHKPRWQSRW